MEQTIKNIIDVYIVSQKAENSPPLGTILGNLGVNSAKFCSEFNEYTKDLPNYLTCSVKIFVYENKSFSFKVSTPPLGSVINLVKFEKITTDLGRTFMEDCVKLSDVVQMAQF